MIGYLSGLIIDKDSTSVLLLAGSVGYRVFVSSDLIATTKADHKVQLYIHTSVREDDISLYGFPGKDEMEFFQKLLSVSGIGPKMAMEILSTPLSLTKNAIISNDIATLTKIKGLGKKTAERLCLELHNKIEPVMTGSSKLGSAVHDEAISALESLGYERHQIIKSMSKLPSDINGTEEIVKYFLKSAS